MEDITLFTQSAAGSGREANDANNKKRETILAGLFNGKFQDFLHDDRWSTLKTKFRQALEKIGQSAGLLAPYEISLQQKGGRGFNYDFLVTINGREFRIEFKFGGTSVTNIPEYFNPAADKPFHLVLYARYFYHNFLPDIVALVPNLEIPNEAAYMAEIHKNSSKNTFFTKLKEAEKDPVFYKQKSEIVKRSITAFLHNNLQTTDFKAITAEFQRSQENKWFILYNAGTFHHDNIHPDELIVDGPADIRNGNLLVLKAKQHGTSHEMLLRWKNHQGVLYPAWQISMKRAVAASATAAP